jgi:hypothetical protein
MDPVELPLLKNIRQLVNSWFPTSEMRSRRARCSGIMSVGIIFDWTMQEQAREARSLGAGKHVQDGIVRA